MVTILRDNQNRSASGIHERRASMRQQTADEKALSIETVLSTEQPVRMWDWDRWEAIDEILLASGRSVAESVPLLDSHRTETINRVLGHVENVRTEVADTVGLMLFDASDPEAVKAFNKYRGNHATDVSVGYIVTAYMEVKPGEAVTIESRTFTAGTRRLRIATAWRLNELSCVARGADSKAKVRTEGEQTARMSQLTDVEIDQLLQRSAGTLVTSQIESTETPSVVINITNGQIETPAERSAGNSSDAGNGKNERTSIMTTATKPENTGVDENEILKRGIQMEHKRQKENQAELQRKREIRLQIVERGVAEREERWQFKLDKKAGVSDFHGAEALLKFCESGLLTKDQARTLARLDADPEVILRALNRFKTEGASPNQSIEDTIQYLKRTFGSIPPDEDITRFSLRAACERCRRELFHVKSGDDGFGTYYGDDEDDWLTEDVERNVARSSLTCGF